MTRKIKMKRIIALITGAGLFLTTGQAYASANPMGTVATVATTSSTTFKSTSTSTTKTTTTVSLPKTKRSTTTTPTVIKTALSPSGIEAACPGSNPYLNNAIPSPTCPVMSGVLTLENLQPAIVERKPAYYWYPALCTIISERWDTYYNPYWGIQSGGWSGGIRVVEDDGHCTGRQFPMYVGIFITPVFANIYGVGGPYNAACRPHRDSLTGAAFIDTASTSASGPNCAGRTYYGIYGDYERGYYTAEIEARTYVSDIPLRLTHQIY